MSSKSSNMGLIYLLGTNHMDLKGPERLRKFLGFIRPSAIGVEASEELIKLKLSERQFVVAEMERQKQFERTMIGAYNILGQDFQKREYPWALDISITMGYEIWASYEHQKENPTMEIYPVHSHEVLERRSPEMYKKAVGEENIDSEGAFNQNFFDELGKLTKDEFQKFIDSGYSNTHKEAYRNPQLREITIECDDAMEPRIRKVVSQNPSGVTVIVAGSNHFFGEYENNLYERLKDLSPTRVRLPDVDKF